MPRTEQYLLPDGSLTSDRRRGAVLVAPADVARWAAAHTAVIPGHVFLGCAQHETDYAANEIDTEESGFQSIGLYQVSQLEAARAGEPKALLFCPWTSTRIMARLMEYALDQIVRAAGLGEQSPDVWAYLAIVHNQGLGAALKSIRSYGLDWAAYKVRNATTNVRGIIPYGDDCMPSSRTMSL